jgi:hypothetical protein
MENENLDLNLVNPADLPRLLAEMNAKMAQHNLYLEKNYASMESLSLAIKQLDADIKKLNKTEEVSLQLRQALTAFVEQHINPLYYQMKMYTALPGASKVKHHRLTAGKTQNSAN